MRPVYRAASVVIALALLCESAAAADPFKRIAIMPFQNLNGGKAQDSVGVGIAETLITELGRIPDITLVERSRLNDAQKEIKLGQSGAVDESTAQRMGKFLGADGVVVGSFQTVGDTLRISARIIDVQTAQVRDATKVDGRPGDLLNLQDQLAAKLLETMKGTLGDTDRRRLGSSPSSSLDALRAFSDGVAYHKLDLFQDAITAFDKALALDPNYIDAQYYKGLAFAKLKRWDDAIDAFKRTLPRAQTEQTVKWSWNAPVDGGASIRTVYPAVETTAFTVQGIGLSPEAIVGARRLLVYSEVVDNHTIFHLVDPIRHATQRLEVAEPILDVGLAFASDRVVLLPAPTAAGLAAGKIGMYGVSPVDGTVLWHRDLSAPPGSIPLFGVIDRMFWTYSSATHQIVAMTDTALEPKWERNGIDLDAIPASIVSTRAHGNIVIAKSGSEKRIHAIRAGDGQDAWTADLQTDKTYHIVTDRVVVVFEPERRVFAIDAETGKTIVDVPIKQMARVRPFGLLGTYVTVPSAAHADGVYFVSEAKEIVAIDLAATTPAARRQRWKTAALKDIRGLTAHGGHVYAGTEDGDVLTIDEGSGAVSATRVSNKPVDVHYSGDDVVIAATPDAVFGIHPETGAKLWEFAASSRTKRPVYFKGIVILESSGTSRLSALDARSGALLWQYTGGLAGDGIIGDLGAAAPKVYFGEESVFIMQPWGVVEYALATNVGQSITRKEALTGLASALLEKGELDEAARFAAVVASEGDPNYPPLRYLRSRLAQARGNAAESLGELLTYADLVGRQSKAGEEILADLKRNRGLIWNTEVGAQLGGALLVEGKLIANNDAQIVALDARNGKQLWRYPGERIVYRVYDPTSRRLFYASRPSRDPRTAVWYVIDIEKGERREFARITTNADVVGLLSAYANGRLFLATQSVALNVQPIRSEITISSFNATSGTRLWEKLIEAPLVSFDRTGIVFYPKGDFLVYSLGPDLWILRGEDGVVHGQYSGDANIMGRYLQADERLADPDVAYFGTSGGGIVGYSVSAKTAVLKTTIPGVSSEYAIGGALIREGTLIDVDNGSLFAFDVRPETGAANRLKWRTDPTRDGWFTSFRPFGADLWATRDDRTGVRIDLATGRILNEYPLLWYGSVVEEGDRRYGFTTDGLAFAMQLKPKSK